MRTAAILGLTITLLLTVSARADTVLGLYVGYQYWLSEADGSVGVDDDEVDFDWSSEGQNSFYAALEHPIPLVPNLLIRYNELSGSDNVDDLSAFDVFTLEGRVDLNLDNTDFVFYWELLDNWLNLDLGLNIKYVNGKLSGEDRDGNTDRISITAPIPMLYVAPRFKLPLTGLSIGGDASVLWIGDYKIFDGRADVRYLFVDNPIIDVGVELGYRYATVDVDDVSDFYGDIDFYGPYLGLMIHF